MRDCFACLIALLVIVNAQHDASAGLVGHWKLDEGSGNVAADSSGNGNDVTFNGSPQWVKGVAKGALSFAGNDFLEVATASKKLKPASLTVAAWVKVAPSTREWAWVAGQGDNYGLVVNRNDDDSVFFYVHSKGGEWVGTSSGDVHIRDGRWHHIVGLFDANAKKLFVYKDGVRVGAQDADVAVDYSIGNGFSIGSMQGERRFHGVIDDVRVYSHVLSQAELASLASAALARQESGPKPTGPKPTGPKPTGVTHGRRPFGVVFHKDTLTRLKGNGDNWRLTWMADDSQVTQMCDGSWMGGKGYHNHLYRILGGPDGFVREDIPAYPDFSGKAGSWFGYGIVSVDGVLYSTASKTPGPQWSGPFRGIKLLKSKDNGKTWYRVDRHGKERKIGPQDDARNEVNDKEMFFLEEFGLPHQKQMGYPFSYVDFVNCGKENSTARDSYLYIYSPEGAHAHKLLLARVPKDKLGNRDAWEYFVRYEGTKPIWSKDLRKRGYVHTFPETSQEGNCFGWYSWLPSVVWNEGLGLYIMVNGGTYAGHKMTSSDSDYYDAWMHTKTGSLGFWYSQDPYGPWHQFFYTDYWTVDNPKNRTYQPVLSPKWISKDGREMILIWSDAMENAKGQSHSVNYRWNHMRITIRTQ